MSRLQGEGLELRGFALFRLRVGRGHSQETFGDCVVGLEFRVYRV